ncbi:unnamed protein product [Mytilus edulis]|uniref:Uncharacterized protein n=1 Tax=Mytilus edulis TaxID=6550 RepID=A0A8S3U241_MYTED|nr:unnamed protein product [Mytilus edulis]
MIETIELFEITGSTILIKKTLLSYQTCFGLSVNSDGTILAATRSPVNGIVVIDLNGFILKRVNLKLSRINYVHCYENKIIVTELESKEILVFNLDGKKIKRFTFDGEPDLRNVCVDKHGNIFVTALKARKVTVISEKDDRRKDLMRPADGFMNPKAIVYNPKNGTIIIADKDGQFSAFMTLFILNKTYIFY